MTQTLDKNQAKDRLDFRKIAPSEIYIPQGIEVDQKEVEKYTEILKKRGAIPDIIITADNTLVEGINELRAAIDTSQKFILARIKPGQGIKNSSNFIEIEVSKLNPHPLQKQIYGDEGDIKESKVFQAIAETGDIEPITVVCDRENPGFYRIIKGHTRTKSAIALGMLTIRAYIAEYANQQEEDEAFLSSNTTREETNEQKARRAAAWWEIIEEKNQQRIKAGKADGQNTRTRDEVGKLVGWSGFTAANAVKVIQELPTLPATEAEEVRQKLNKSVDAAHKAIAPSKSPKSPKQKAWKPEIFEKVRIIRGAHDGKRGEIRGISGSYCLVWLEGESLNSRHNLPIYELAPIAEENPVQNSAEGEIAQKAKELGLKNGKQILPDKQRNEGFNPKEISAVPASHTGLYSPADIAIALLNLKPEQISYALALALPDMSREQIEALDNALSKNWSKVA
ncbi:hypothetical protein NIES4101_53330 [Calothrix sp. NIES-4101]|nr:hypothetical protein NIES4101_53330 [Calothrix sp. NIES-4101]